MKNVQVLKKVKVIPQDVLMIKAVSNYTKIHFVSGKTFILAKTLKTLTNDFMPFGFVRINRSSTVNSNFIKKLDQNHVILSNKLELSISRRRKENFMVFYSNKLKQSTI